MIAHPGISSPSARPLGVTGTQSVLALVRQLLPASERNRRLRWNDRLSDLGVSSLKLLSLIIDLEDQFNLSLQELGRLSTHSTLGCLVQVCLHTDGLRDEPITIHS